MTINFVDRISSLDTGYKSGDLSIYPKGRDNYTTLYKAANNASTFLTQSLTYTARFLVVDNTTSFPDNGLVKVGTEIIYYSSKTLTTFQGIKRAFAGTKQKVWTSGMSVQASVMAEHHNTVKDATINIEKNLGVKKTPTVDSLNGILSGLEVNFLAPVPLFRAAPRVGPPPLQVHFQNFSDAPPIRFLWDFGDGSSSLEASPTHLYLTSGTYSVTLNMITELGATGIATKKDYIVVDIEQSIPFFYVTPAVGNTSTVFTFVDQSKGDIVSRYWLWDDGTTTVQSDADVEIATHQYLVAGQYSPNLLLAFADGTLRKVSLNDMITVTN